MKLKQLDDDNYTNNFEDSYHFICTGCLDPVEMVMKDNGILECPECKTEFVVEGGNNVSKEKAEKLNDLKKNEYKELQDAMNKYEKMEEEVRKSLDPFEDSEKLTLLHLIHKEMDSIGKHMEEIENGINQGYTR